MNSYPYGSPPIINKAPDHQPELPILDLTRRKIVGDMETELVNFHCRARTVAEAKEGILFLMECEQTHKDLEDERKKGEVKK